MFKRIARKHSLEIALAGIVLLSLIVSMIDPVTSTVTGESVGLLLSTAICSVLIGLIAGPILYIEAHFQEEITRLQREIDCLES